MSRYPHKRLTEDYEDRVKIEDNTVKAICSCLVPSYIETLPVSSMNIAEAFEYEGQALA